MHHMVHTYLHACIHMTDDFRDLVLGWIDQQPYQCPANLVHNFEGLQAFVTKCMQSPTDPCSHPMPPKLTTLTTWPQDTGRFCMCVRSQL